MKDRLTKEIIYWDHRAPRAEGAGSWRGSNARLNSAARPAADELQRALEKRLEELEQERQLSPLPPVVVGGALIVPGGLLASSRGKRARAGDSSRHARRRASRRLAMEAVMAAERGLGYEPRDVSHEKLGYDIESRMPGTGRLRFIEVKGRVAGAGTVTVTKNEILTGLNKPDDFILAIVELDRAT